MRRAREGGRRRRVRGTAARGLSLHCRVVSPMRAWWCVGPLLWNPGRGLLLQLADDFVDLVQYSVDTEPRVGVEEEEQDTKNERKDNDNHNVKVLGEYRPWYKSLLDEESFRLYFPNLSSRRARWWDGSTCACPSWPMALRLCVYASSPVYGWCMRVCLCAGTTRGSWKGADDSVNSGDASDHSRSEAISVMMVLAAMLVSPCPSRWCRCRRWTWCPHGRPSD